PARGPRPERKPGPLTADPERKTAGEALPARQALHRPATAPAFGVRAGTTVRRKRRGPRGARGRQRTVFRFNQALFGGPVMAAVDYFLKIDGIPGESHDAKHKDEIQVDSWSFGGRQSGTFAEGGGGGAGKVQMFDVSFSEKVSKASPKLMLACATGE